MRIQSSEHIVEHDAVKEKERTETGPDLPGAVRCLQVCSSVDGTGECDSSTLASTQLKQKVNQTVLVPMDMIVP